MRTTRRPGAARKRVTIQGITTAGDFVEEALATAGASASANTSNDYIRLLRHWVSKSGTYATPLVGGHGGDIVIENAAGTEDWATIDASAYPLGQSEIGCYCSWNNTQQYIIEVEITVDANRTTDAILLRRESVLDAAPPYQAPRILKQVIGIDQPSTLPMYLGPFSAGTDFIWIGRVNTGSALIEVSTVFLVVEV